MKPSFYDRPVVEVARDLLGHVVRFGTGAGVIVETEAYHQIEPACHAYKGLTPRTRTLTTGSPAELVTVPVITPPLINSSFTESPAR